MGMRNKLTTTKFIAMTQIEKEAEQIYPFIDGNDEHNRIATIRRFAYINGANRNAWISVDVPPSKNIKVIVAHLNGNIGFARHDGKEWIDDDTFIVRPVAWQLAPTYSPPTP